MAAVPSGTKPCPEHGNLTDMKLRKKARRSPHGSKQQIRSSAALWRGFRVQRRLENTPSIWPGEGGMWVPIVAD